MDGVLPQLSGCLHQSAARLHGQQVERLSIALYLSANSAGVVILETEMLRTILARSLLTLVLLTLIALGPSHTDARGQPKACGSNIRPIEVHQTTLHYFECGQGEPLVFVHGAFGDLQTFREQVEAFATRFRVIVYSRRFFPPNASPRATDISPLGIHVADLRTLITDLKAGPAHLVGSSYGAYIALALAVDHPESFVALSSANLPFGRSSPARRWQKACASP